MKPLKVLVFSPTYEGKEYCRKEFVDNVNKFTYPNYDFLMIDNSERGTYYYKLIKEGVPVVRVPRGSNSRIALANAQNYARQYAIDNDYDYVLSLESDLFPPPDIIERLIVHSKPVVGALYNIGGTREGQPIVPCVFVTTLKDNGTHGTRLITKQEHAEMKAVGGVHKVHGMGVGCTLISTSVLKDYWFWTDNRFDNKHSDVYFYMDLWNKKVPVFVDYDTFVIHKPSDWSMVKDR